MNLSVYASQAYQRVTHTAGVMDVGPRETCVSFSCEVTALAAGPAI